jgi:immune inhibitor A
LKNKKLIFSSLIHFLILGLLISSCVFQNEKPAINPNETATTKQITSTDNPEIGAIGEKQKEFISGALETLQTLIAAEVPERDLYSVTKRFKNNNGNSQPVINRNYRVGDEREFWVLDTTANTYQKILADLVFITPHSYFWAQQGVSFDEKDVAIVSNIFSDKIYPTNRAFFGSEPIPGIDGDERILILYTRGMGRAAGLFSSADSVSSAIDEYSNQAEMIYISADYVDLSNHDYVAKDIMAHELQHLIHYSLDHNEASWISEGFSELAVFINGYGPSDFQDYFVSNPNVQLTFWPGDDQGDSMPHYGAAFMFMKYFLDRFGEEATKSLVAEKANDYQSVELVLEHIQKTSAIMEPEITGDELFRDWTIANIINPNLDVIPDMYKYKDYQPPAFSIGRLTDSNSVWQRNKVQQFGTQYFEINCSSDCSFELQGQPTVNLFPVDPHSGKYFVWSNKGDESEMTFSREFDFRNYSGPITLQYWTWYDIEKDYDYLYLTASVDGEDWKIIHTPRCTESNPTGANYGCGYSGKSNRWVQEKVDLSAFAGKKVMVRFDYLTDLAVNGEGMVLDDITIPQINYFEDFESGLGGWIAEGFVRIQNQLPQNYLVSLVQIGEKLKVTPLFFDINEKIQFRLNNLTGELKNYLIISGITKYITTPADYEIRLMPI